MADVSVAVVAAEVLVLVAWAADSRAGSSAGQAVRLGACLWLVSLHTRVHIGAAVVGLPPLVITLGAMLLVARSTAALGRRQLFRSRKPSPSWSALVGVAAAITVPYAVLAAAVAKVADTPTLYPSPLTALVGGFVVAALGGGIGVLRLRKVEGLPLVRDAVPEPVRTVVAAAVGALNAIAVVATVLVAALLLAHHQLAGQLAGALAPGALGSVVFTILQVTLAPLLIVGAGAWLIGPGFAVGAGTSVTPWTTSLGPVPALPMLAVLPNGATHVGNVALLVPVFAGVLAGVLVLRRHPLADWWRAPALVVAAAALAGAIACLFAYAAGGPAGPARLLTVGPSGWRVGLALAGELALGGLLATGARAAWVTRAKTSAGMTQVSTTTLAGLGSVARRVRRRH